MAAGVSLLAGACSISSIIYMEEVEVRPLLILLAATIIMVVFLGSTKEWNSWPEATAKLRDELVWFND